MPEGHTIHHAMRKQGRLFAGQVLACSSPQGRFDGGAERMHGQTLLRTEAKGKHAFWHLANGDVLHVHLGLYGRWRVHKGQAPDPKGAIRLRVQGDTHALDLIGPTRCELLDADGHRAVLDRLGDDPLRDDADPERVVARLQRSRKAIGALLLDQKLIAGIGNVYRAELLFVGQLDPHRPGRDLATSDLERLWRNTCTLLAVGVKHNAIRVVGEATEGPLGGEAVDPADHEVPSRYGTKKDRLWVYKRSSCKLCGGAIQTGELASRTLYWCPSCQKG